MGQGRETFRTVSTSVLPIGTALGAPIYDRQNTKLLGAGVAITADLLDRMKKRGIRSVIVSQRDLARLYAYQPQGTAKHGVGVRRSVRCSLRSPGSSDLDRRIDGGHNLRLTASQEAFRQQIRTHGTDRYEAELITRFAEAHEQSVEDLATTSDALMDERKADIEHLWGLASSALQRAADDVDLFTCLGINPFFHEFPTRHSVHVASLAIALGIQLELDEKTLVELGIGCLLHDIGMRLAVRSRYQDHRELTDAEFQEVTRHPIYSLELLSAELNHLPVSSQMVIYQLHERCDGSGYPRGRKADDIHDLAKIAGLADAYVALVSPRPHRPGLQPYHAVKVLLAEVQEGMFDPSSVRALLQTISLFPLGSFVAIGGQMVGKVIRSNAAKYDRPILEVWDRSDLSSEPQVIDLSESDLSISRTLPRLPQEI